MSYEPFVGELDKPNAVTSFQEFTGELDKPVEPDVSGETDQEVVTSARAWRGAGAGRGSFADPRRLDVNGGHEKSVKEAAIQKSMDSLRSLNGDATDAQLRGLSESAYNPSTGEVEIEKNRGQNTQAYMDKARENLVYQQGLDRVKAKANENPVSYALGSGLISAATGLANAPQAIVNAPLEYIDRVGGAISGEAVNTPKLPKWGFTKEAMDVAGAASPDVANKGLSESWGDGDFGTMLMANHQERQ